MERTTYDIIVWTLVMVDALLIAWALNSALDRRTNSR